MSHHQHLPLLAHNGCSLSPQSVSPQLPLLHQLHQQQQQQQQSSIKLEPANHHPHHLSEAHQHNLSINATITGTTTTTTATSTTTTNSSHNHLQQHHHQQQSSHHQHQQHQHQPSQANHQNTNTSSTTNTNTSFLIKDILRYEGQKRKQRKARTAFSDHQLKELEASFGAKMYLTVQDRVELAAKLKLSDTQVKTWYQNRRTKQKRQTAVGVELLHETQHLLAYQSVLNGPNAQWFFNNYSPNPHLSMAAISAAALIAQRMQLHQSAASATGTSQASPSANPYSPQE